MARTNFEKNFDLCFEIPFSAVIRGDHIYETIWAGVVGQELTAKPDERKEALDYDNFQLSPKKKKTKRT